MKAYLVIRNIRRLSTNTGFSMILSAWADGSDAADMARAENEAVPLSDAADILGCEIAHTVTEITIRGGGRNR
jgi:hypothetical protein